MAFLLVELALEIFDFLAQFVFGASCTGIFDPG